MTVHKVLADIVDALSRNRQEHEARRITLLNHRVGRVEHHLKLKPLPNAGDQ